MYVLICCLFVYYPPPFLVPDVCLGDPVTEASIPVLYPGLCRVIIVEQLLLSTTPATHLWQPTPPLLSPLQPTACSPPTRGNLLS